MTWRSKEKAMSGERVIPFRGRPVPEAGTPRDQCAVRQVGDRFELIHRGRVVVDLSIEQAMDVGEELWQRAVLASRGRG